MPDSGGALRRDTGEALLAVVLPTLFLVTGVLLPLELAFSAGPFMNALLPPVLLAVGSAGYAVDRRLERERASAFVARLREAILILASSILSGWLLLLLSNGPPMPLARAASTLDFWVWLSLIAAQWLFSTAVCRALAKRALFRESVERWGGGDSAAAYRDFAEEAGEALAALRRIRRIVAFFAIWSVAVALLIEWVLGRSLGMVEELLIALALLVELAVMKPLGDWEREQTLMGEGIRVSENDHLAGSAAAFLLALPCLAGAILLAAAPPLLPQSLLAAFFHWLASLFNHPLRTAALPPPPAPPPSSLVRPELLERLAGGPPPPPSLLLEEILRIAGRVLLVLLALATLWLVVHPLFRPRSGNPRTPAALLALLSQRVAALFRSLAEWLASFGTALTAAGEAPAGGRLRAIIAAAAGNRRSRRALRGGNARRFSRSFQKLVRWAEGKGVPFSTSMGPLEYARLVARQVPDAVPAVEEIALLFERNLFARAPLSADGLSAYYEKIRTVTRR